MKSSHSYILSIDQGTSSSRCLLFDEAVNIVAVHQVEHQQIYPQNGWVEHDPLEIWNNIKICMRKVCDGIQVDQIRAVGITNQRETSLLWNKKTGKPYHNAIVWNDTRTNDICNEISQGNSRKYHSITGLPIATYFSISKIIYLLRTVPGLLSDALNGDVLFGTIDTWLVWKLTNHTTHVTDVTNASRTLLMNIHTQTWEPKILNENGIPMNILPKILPSCHYFGSIQHIPSENINQNNSIEFLNGIPITGILGDQQAALFGQACFQSSNMKCTFGTGAFLLMNTGNKPIFSNIGLLTTIGTLFNPFHSFIYSNIQLLIQKS